MADTEIQQGGEDLPGQRQGGRSRGGRSRGRGRGRGGARRGEPTFSKTVVVAKRMPLETDDASVEALFAQKGEIANFKGKPSGKGDTKFYTVRYESEDAAAAALALDGADFNGQPLSVEAKRIVPRLKTVEMVYEAKPNRIFVGDLGGSMSEEDIQAKFGACGNVTEIDLARNRNFAFITFETEAEAAAACSLDGSVVGEQTIRVRKEETRTKRVPVVDEDGEVAAAPRRTRKKRRNESRVFMGGVPANCDLSVLQEVFPGIKKGSVKEQVAFVVFETVEQAEAAVERNGEAVFGGEPVRIEKSRR